MTIVEAGHYYKVNGPTTLSLQGWAIGQELAGELPHARLALFVDDYHPVQDYLHPNDSLLSETSANQAAVQLQTEADHVFFEAKLADAAAQEALELLDNRLIKLRKGVLTAAGVRLGTAAGTGLTELKPTCVFLDYLLLAQKTKLGPDQITVLPDSYASQQAQLTAVLGKLSIPGLQSYQTMYYNNGGLLTEAVAA